MDNIFFVSLIERPYDDIYEIHYTSSREKCIEFIKQALEDAKSGIEDTTILRITKAEIDKYFGGYEIIDEKRAIDYYD
jgi:hypothetical protein